MSDYYDLPVLHLLRKTPKGFARSPYAVESNPWSRRGEIEAALLFRGVIVSAYGFIETRLSDLAIQVSRLECYADLRSTFPYSTKKRLEFLRSAFSFGPLKPFERTAQQFFRRFEDKAEIRHLVAHCRMQVLPDWGVTLEDIDVKDRKILRRTKNFTIEEFERLAFKAARLSRLAQLLSYKLDEKDILPKLQT